MGFCWLHEQSLRRKRRKPLQLVRWIRRVYHQANKTIYCFYKHLGAWFWLCVAPSSIYFDSLPGSSASSRGEKRYFQSWELRNLFCFLHLHPWMFINISYSPLCPVSYASNLGPVLVYYCCTANCPKLSSLKQHTFLPLEFPRVRSIGVA